MGRSSLAVALVLASSVLGGCASTLRAPATPAATAPTVVHPVIVTPTDVTTEPELAARAERALVEQRWLDAVEAYRTLVAANPTPEHAAEYLFDLGLALEGAQLRGEARDAFLDVARRFPDGPRARSALVRAASLDAYLEDWGALSAIGDALLARTDLADLDRLVALGARGLSLIELGDDVAASRDIYDGLELADRLHYGARDVLPVAVAELRFALGELRRVRSERIVFDPLPSDFVDELEERCGGLLAAQQSYAMAVRSIDPHWAAMSGYRVGEMYRRLHDELVRIPPPSASKTTEQKDVFYAFLHVRYRVLLEKGLRQIDQPLALGERINDTSAWVQRARAARDAMQAALDEEKARMARMPFKEEDIGTALELLRKKTLAQASKGK